MFNVDQVKSFVRSLVIAAGAFVVGKGWLSNELVMEIAGGVSALAAGLWGIWFHSGATKVELAEVVLGDADAQTDAKVVVAAEKLVG